MSSLKFPHVLGRAAVGGFLAMCATGALAAGDPEFVVSHRSSDDTRAVKVRVSDLDLNDTFAQRTLAIRVERAAREVCDVEEGSKLDKLPSAKSCLTAAKAGALAQLKARGVWTPSSFANSGGMR